MCVNVSYSSLPESLRSRLAAVFGMKPGEVARFEEHPLQVEYLDNGTALVHVTKVVLTDAAALQHLLSIDGPHRHPEMFTLVASGEGSQLMVISVCTPPQIADSTKSKLVDDPLGHVAQLV